VKPKPRQAAGRVEYPTQIRLADVPAVIADIQRALKECDVEKAERLVREALVAARKAKP